MFQKIVPPYLLGSPGAGWGRETEFWEVNVLVFRVGCMIYYVLLKQSGEIGLKREIYTR